MSQQDVLVYCDKLQTALHYQNEKFANEIQECKREKRNLQSQTEWYAKEIERWRVRSCSPLLFPNFCSQAAALRVEHGFLIKIAHFFFCSFLCRFTMVTSWSWSTAMVYWYGPQYELRQTHC